MNLFFVVIEVFLIIRVIIYYILSLASDKPPFWLRFMGDVMLYLSEVFLTAFIMHLSLETLKNNHSVRESFRSSNLINSFVKDKHHLQIDDDS